MEKKDSGLHADQKAQGVWERRTADRRYGQNQLFGSFRVDSGGPAVSRDDPTDSALAAIASILDKPAGRPTDREGQKAAGAAQPEIDPVDEVRISEVEMTEPQAPETQDPETQVPETYVSEAQIPETSAVEPSPQPEPPPLPSADLDGYVKYGPGPLDAIRFKWTARAAGDGMYFVDETIGNSSRPMTSGPMPKEEAIIFIDGRERDARRRFEALKSEMTGKGIAAGYRGDPEGGEI
jgi:hypothetical protein